MTIKIDGQPMRVVPAKVTTEMYAAWEASPVTFANQPQQDLDAMLAAAPTAPDEVLVEMVRVLDALLSVACKQSLTMAIDDRDRVVKAWRAAGLVCLQSAEWDF